MRLPRSFACVACTATLLSIAFEASAADRINRRGDKAVAGDVTAIAKDKITVKPSVGNPVDVPANEVLSVEWGAEASELNLARGAEESGNFERALEFYAKSATSTDANVKVDVEFLTARTTATMALQGDATKLDDAIKKLDAFTKANGSSFRYFPAVLLLGQVQLLKEDFDNAEKSFASLSQAPWAEYKMAAQNATARLAIRKGSLDAALSAYEQVIGQNVTAPAEVSKRNEALIGKGNVLLQQSKADMALETINEAISKTEAEDSAVLAEAFVLKGECLKAQGKVQEAILAYLHIPVLFEREKTWHAQALFNLTQLYPKVDQADRGLAARQELQETYPESPWTKKLGQ